MRSRFELHHFYQELVMINDAPLVRLSMPVGFLMGAGIIILAAAGLSAASAATMNDMGRAIVEHGSASGAPACISCPGTDLGGNAGLKAPALRGRPSDYILARLAHYAGPQGRNPLMKQVATVLTPSERRAAAGYISSLKLPAARHRN